MPPRPQVVAWYVGDNTANCVGWLTKELLPGSAAAYRFNDNNTCAREFCMDEHSPRGTKVLNPAPPIAFLRRLLRHLVHVADSGLVHPPAWELERWRDVLGHLAQIPVGTSQSPLPQRPVLVYQEAPIFTFPNLTGVEALEFYGVYPGEQIGLSSALDLLSAARNTMMFSGFTDDQPRQPDRNLLPFICAARMPERVRVECQLHPDAVNRRTGAHAAAKRLQPDPDRRWCCRPQRHAADVVRRFFAILRSLATSGRR